MIDTVLLIAVLIFLTVVSFTLAVAGIIRSRQERRSLVHKIRGTTGSAAGPVVTEMASLSGELPKGKFLRILGSWGEKLRPNDENSYSFIRKSLLRAGYRHQSGPVIFYGTKLFLSSLLALSFFFLRVLFVSRFLPAQIMAGSVLLAVIGFYLPNGYIRVKTAMRREEFIMGFPDALDLMVVCVEAGMSLDAAIQRVGEEMRLKNKIVADEFQLLSLELRAGKPRKEALRNLAMRVDFEDVTSLVSLLIQTDKFGTSVAQALRVHSDAMRTQRRLRGEERAAKVAVKLVFPLILCILPALFVVVAGPAIIQIIRALLPALGGS